MPPPYSRPAALPLPPRIPPTAHLPPTASQRGTGTARATRELWAIRGLSAVRSARRGGDLHAGLAHPGPGELALLRRHRGGEITEHADGHPGGDGVERRLLDAVRLDRKSTRL